MRTALRVVNPYSLCKLGGGYQTPSPLFIHLFESRCGPTSHRGNGAWPAPNAGSGAFSRVSGLGTLPKRVINDSRIRVCRRLDRTTCRAVANIMSAA